MLFRLLKKRDIDHFVCEYLLVMNKQKDFMNTCDEQKVELVSMICEVKRMKV